MKKGAEDIKAQVDKDNESGFPIASFLILGFIIIILLLIWDKLNERMRGSGYSPSKKKSHSI